MAKRMNPSEKLIEMLKYKRPEGSIHQTLFCNRFIAPLMGKPDSFGNYTKIIGDAPNVSFMAHHDTVHKESGFQTVFLDNGILSSDSNCLGADCTTGVWLILELIKAKIPGVYVIHAGEELGCIGSRALVASEPAWLDHVDFAISFDRMKTGSIITHQMGYRTASEAFSESLSDILALGHESDSGGSYTDSNEYIDVVAECTNLSVGYYNQHTAKETQDLVYAMQLRDRLINADWSKLVKDRKPGETDYLDWDYGFYRGDNYKRTLSVKQFIQDYPDELAEILEYLGVTGDMLSDELDQMYNFNKEVM
jgi:hypothetical protein